MSGAIEDGGNAFPTVQERGPHDQAGFKDFRPLVYAAPQPAEPAQPATQAGAEALRHSANEWADMATNGLQWIRNIAEGISTATDALANMEQNLLHCQKVNDAPEVQRFVRAAGAAQPTEQPSQDALAAEGANMSEATAWDIACLLWIAFCVLMVFLTIGMEDSKPPR